MSANTSATSGLRPKKQTKLAVGIEDAIRRRAYELYVHRGGEPGRDLEDWLRAEEELAQKKSRRIAA